MHVRAYADEANGYGYANVKMRSMPRQSTSPLAMHPHSVEGGCLAARTWTARTTRASKRRLEAIQRGLRRLQALLASLPRERRRHAIERLSEGVRSALIRHMESVGVSPIATEEKHGLSIPGSTLRGRRRARETSAGGTTSPEGSRAAFRSPGQHETHGGLLQLGSCVSGPNGLAQPPTSRGRGFRWRGRWTRARGGSGAVSALRVGGGKQYIARITIDSIAINSRCIKSKAKAQRLRGLLSRLQQASRWMGLHAVAPFCVEDWLCAVFSRNAQAHRSPPVPPDLGPLLREETWRFRAMVDARAWAGRIVSSRTVGSVEEALLFRRRLEDARARGYGALRAAWAQCMSRSRMASRPAAAAAAPTGAGDAASSCSSRLAMLDKCYAETFARRRLSLQKRAEEFIAPAVAVNPRIEGLVARIGQRLDRMMVAEGRHSARVQTATTPMEDETLLAPV